MEFSNKDYHSKKIFSFFSQAVFLLLSVIVSFIIALGFSYYLGFSRVGPWALSYFVFYFTFFLSVTPLVFFKQYPYLSLIPIGLLAGWFLVGSMLIPKEVEKLYTNIARESIPIYPNIELADITYTPSRMFQNDPTVTLQYQPTDSEEEFVRVKEFYANKYKDSQWQLYNLQADTINPSLISSDPIRFFSQSAHGNFFLKRLLGRRIEYYPDIIVLREKDGSIKVSAHF